MLNTLLRSLDSFEIGALDFAGIKFAALCFVVIFLVWDIVFDSKFKYLVQVLFEDTECIMEICKKFFLKICYYSRKGQFF